MAEQEHKGEGTGGNMGKDPIDVGGIVNDWTRKALWPVRGQWMVGKVAVVVMSTILESLGHD